MKTKIYFSTLLVMAFVVSNTSHCHAQIADSIKYDHGFLHYHEYGAKNLPALIILTGGPGNSYNQLEEVAKKVIPKFRSILLEQRGTGKSIPTPFDSTTVTVKEVTKDIKTLMDSLEIKQSILLGHSWGGMLAMNFASEFPSSVNHLILIAPGPHKDAKNGFNVLLTNRRHTRSFEENQRLDHLNKLIGNNEADSLEIIESKKLLRRAYIFANPIPDSLFQKINVSSNRITSGLLINDIFKNYDVSNSLNNFKGQIDIISGRQDVVGFFSYELKQDIPKANLYWINECGHFPMYEKPKEFYEILDGILKAH